MLLGLASTVIKAAAKLIGGTTAKTVSDVINTVQSTIGENKQLQLEFKEIEIEIAKIHAADLANARDLIKLESSSTDAYVRRARPTFMYLFYVVAVFNFIVMPVASIFFVFDIVYPQLPEEMYWLFGTAFTGYAGFRTFEKIKKAT